MSVTVKTQQEIFDDINLRRVRLGLPPIPIFMEPMFLDGMQRAGLIRRYDSDITPGPVYLAPVEV